MYIVFLQFIAAALVGLLKYRNLQRFVCSRQGTLVPTKLARMQHLSLTIDKTLPFSGRWRCFQFWFAIFKHRLKRLVNDFSRHSQMVTFHNNLFGSAKFKFNYFIYSIHVYYKYLLLAFKK